MKKVSERLGFGVVGTGQIAAEFVRALERSGRCCVVNVVGSSRDKAREFAARFGLPRAAASLDELLSDPEVGAVYVATPHPSHEAHASAALEAGRAVLCEKPLALDAASVERLVDIARSRGVFLMEAFMYRSHPLLARVLDVLRGGAVGAPLHLRSVFGYRTPREPNARHFDPALGGGSVLDVGCYPVSLARLVAGVAQGMPLAEPVQLSGGGRLGPTGVDELATLRLGFEAGFSAELASATRFDLGTESVIFGEEGKLVIPNVWLPEGGRQGLESRFSIHRDGRAVEEVRVTAELSTFALEAEVLAESLPRIEAPWPAMSHADSLGNARVLDAWLAQIHARSAR